MHIALNDTCFSPQMGNNGIMVKPYNLVVMRCHTETQYSILPSFHSFLFQMREKDDLANGGRIGE